MIHALFDLLGIVVDIAAVWLKQDLGAADYRIVRLVFFSAIGAWTALELVRAATGVTHGILRLVTHHIPHGAFRLLCRVGRGLNAAHVRFEQQYQVRLAARKR